MNESTVTLKLTATTQDLNLPLHELAGMLTDLAQELFVAENEGLVQYPCEMKFDADTGELMARLTQSDGDGIDDG